MTQSESDAVLIERSLEDPEIFAVIFERHYRSIHRFVVAGVGSTDGPDLAAEVFLRAFALRDRYRSDYVSASPWLFGIASNLIRGHYRQRARQERAYRRVPFSFSQPDHSVDAVDRVAAETERPRLASALQHLRAADAEVLLLFAVGEFSYTEIAASLGIAEGTVRSRLNRTRTRLRNLLGAVDEFPNDDE